MFSGIAGLYNAVLGATSTELLKPLTKSCQAHTKPSNLNSGFNKRI